MTTYKSIAQSLAHNGVAFPEPPRKSPHPDSIEMVCGSCFLIKPIRPCYRRKGRTPSCDECARERSLAARAAARARAPETISDKVVRRFWDKVERAPSGCWEWRAGVFASGYGAFSLFGRTRKAHRVSWWIEHGNQPPDDMLVCHRCDNTICVRPDHLFLGGNSENQIDSIEKGRSAAPANILVALTREARAKALAARLARFDARAFCARGHLFTPETTREITTRMGARSRKCLVCDREYQRKYKERRSLGLVGNGSAQSVRDGDL